MNAKILKAVIDRIEEEIATPDGGQATPGGGQAVLEVEGSYELIIPLKFLPENASAGNILEISISTNPSEEEAQREKIRKMQERLKGNA